MAAATSPSGKSPVMFGAEQARPSRASVSSTRTRRFSAVVTVTLTSEISWSRRLTQKGVMERMRKAFLFCYRLRGCVLPARLERSVRPGLRPAVAEIVE
jgi:hypothetical protein